MDIVIKLSQFLLSLSLLIVLHEFGHFIPARLFGTRVEKFFLFFDVKFALFKKKIGETVYGIGWLPLGGYVKISGMIDESMDKEQMEQPPQPWEFRSKPAWQRLIIMLGGVTVNFILAFIIYIGIAYAYGERYIQNDNVKDGIWVTNSAMEDIGFRTGDKLVSIDGKPIENFSGSTERLLLSKEVTVERNGDIKKIMMPVDFIDQLMKSREGKEGAGPIMGVRIPFVIMGTDEDSPNAGVIKTRDILVSLNGEKITYADEALARVEGLTGQTVPAVVKRDDKEIKVDLTVDDTGKMGIFYAPGLGLTNLERLGLYEVSRKQYTFMESIPRGLQKGKDRLVSYGKQLKMIFNPETGAYKGVGGFKAIFDLFPQTWSWQAFWEITALLSIMLGVLNLLPIPALDGGHVMFLLYEMVSGRKPSDKFLEYAQIAGFFVLMALVLFANGNDIYRWLFK
ncbi:RIP metalloprotease RseP [Sinomicrobium weinanense]|uniref:Zinc metalloprotease n=1 Tax=Sinomicrobium weinanense TaxID=2842200 RepID=A0A926JVX4_9FLAO|nr:RIP metalloprotease RseP [Sinomicrobium weinanense]MBC9798141.1 RIP metalloprotease RseP [Sinomicrobium weinanense]MBU3123698.1 RIP metalloprotease RseP [Sinomicrobium weinanense]